MPSHLLIRYILIKLKDMINQKSQASCKMKTSLQFPGWNLMPHAWFMKTLPLSYSYNLKRTKES